MPSLPKHVKVGPFVYSIALKPHDEMQKIEGSERQLMGHCDHLRLAIMLRNDMAPGAIAEVLLHEILHACYNAAGSPIEAANTTGMDNCDIEELAVTTVSPSLLQVLRANPSLLEYLRVVS